MTHILIVYGTTDGHTRKVAQVLAEHFRAHLCSVDLLDAAGPYRRLSPESYDGVIVAASVHIGDYQRAVNRWVREHTALLGAMPTAFVSVSLGVLEPGIKPRQELLRIMRRFLDRCGWRPTITKMVAGALPWTRYGWLKRLMMKRIVAKAGVGIDTSRDYEYTDWDDLRNFARDFARLTSERPAEVEMGVTV